jgi:uncharacterized protein (DUF2235 family)
LGIAATSHTERRRRDGRRVRYRLKISWGLMAMTDEESPDQPDGQQHITATSSTPRPPRKFVLFADGTGNAFTTQESNVWRLYEALDRTKPDQVAYYIKGVGTSGWRPLAALDGATGIGVPANVRMLYRFLCWNWRSGDEIYIFGFSRGAFTARTLAALIASQGLVPAVIGGVPVTHADMERNVMSAWRAYRRRTVPWYRACRRSGSHASFATSCSPCFTCFTARTERCGRP